MSSGQPSTAAGYDVVVIGGGLAGLTAGLFSARYGHSTLVLEAAIPGGHLVNVETIEDFPGFPQGIAGYDLCPLVQEQAEQQGAQFALAEVEALEPEPEGRGVRRWCVVTSQGTYHAPAVIVASGSRPKPLGVPGEAVLQGRGISHCATCDGPLFRGRVVGVVGGGSAALQEALTLASHASRVIVFNAEAAFTGQETYRGRVAAEPKIEVRHNVAIQEVLGDRAVTGVRVRRLASGAAGAGATVDAAEVVEVAGLFVYVGQEPNTAFLRGVLPLDGDGRVPADASMQTDRPGLFAAGDVRRGAAHHAVTAAGDGATAAIAAHGYLEARRGSR